MAHLYAEIDSDKHGRKSGKGGDVFLRVDVTRGGKKVGTLGMYEVQSAQPAAFRVIWHPVAREAIMLEDTERKQ